MMLRKFCITVILIGSAIFAHAQRERVANQTEPLTFLGLDFSHARFLEDSKKFASIPQVQLWMKSLNELMETERAKYDVGNMIHRKTPVSYKTEIAIAHNAALDVSVILADSLGAYRHLKEEDIAEIVRSYDSGDSHGLSLLFVVEAFSKKFDRALIWVTFFDADTKEIVLARQATGAAGGFGLRNYWAGAIYDMIKNVRKRDFDTWMGVKK